MGGSRTGASHGYNAEVIRVPKAKGKFYLVLLSPKLNQEFEEQTKKKEVSYSEAFREAVRMWLDESIFLRRIFQLREPLYRYVEQGVISLEDMNKIAEIEELYITPEGQLDIKFKHPHPLQHLLKCYWFERISSLWKKSEED